MTDLSSHSNPDEVIVKHLHWHSSVDFDAEIFSAEATYTVHRVIPAATTLCLDTLNLKIQSVHSVLDGGEKSPLPFSLLLPTEGKPHLGQKLVISLLECNTIKDCENICHISIVYQTTKKCSAVQWLPPAQTAGKKFPYLFTQCFAIHARSLVPCQDRPSVKMTYSANVTVPKWATCVMSALPDGSSEGEKEETTTFKFNQPVPISSYLLAIAVGELVKKDISERCAVWTEPSLAQAAAYEFAETEMFLKIAEDLSGKEYAWGRYDLLCLPPSFPYGGAENPCLTFVTPTLLVGDRSLAGIVAHEIAHSWTGNLVTNATWDHFWLNEGWTKWFERKIMSRFKKDPNLIDFDATLGYQALKEDVDHLPLEATTLVLNIGDGDPDESYSQVAYEKGFNFLRSLERRVGTKEFEDFFKAYVAKFAFHVVTSDEFKDLFMDHFKANHDKVKDIDWDAWFHGPGMLPEDPDYDKSLLEDSERLAEFWMMVDRKGRNVPSMKNLSSVQLVCFLDSLISRCGGTPLQISTLKSINDQYHFSESRNSEILYRYCSLAIAAEDTKILSVVVRFISTQGRLKYVRPLYRALYKSRMGSEVAVSTFLTHKDFYHPICSKMVAIDLSVSKDSTKGKSIDYIFWGGLGIGGALGVAMTAFVILRKRS